MGAAKDSATCSSTTFDQAATIGNLALSIARSSTDVSNQFEQLKALIQSSDKVQSLINANQSKFPLAGTGRNIADLLKADPSTVPTEDIIRLA